MIEWRDLETAFHDSTLERGRQYASGGQVAQIAAEEDGSTTQLTARVQGSDAQPYETRVQLVRSGARVIDIEGRCTCPVGYNCKHAAAVVIKHFGLGAWMASRAPGLSAAAPVPPAFEREPGPNAHRYWIDRLRELNAPKPVAPQTKQLLYVFDASGPRHGAHPIVTLMTTLLRKDGSRGAMQSANSDLTALLNAPPAYVSKADLPLLRELGLSSRRNGIGTGYVVQQNADLLRRLVESGRAGERSQPQMVLHWGAARNGKPQWQLGSDGRQRFGIDTEPPAAVFALESLVYIDAARAEAGPVECEIDPAVATILLEAPPVAPAEAPQVAQALSDVLPQLPGAMPPLPASVKVDKVRAKGIVHLHLENARVTSPYTYEPMRGAVAHVSVDYDGVRAALDDAGGTRLQNGALLALTIDEALHRKTGNRLQSAGFHPFGPQARRNEYESVFFCDEHLLLDVVETKLPHWRKQGWQITLADDFAWQPVEVEAFYFDAEPQDDNQWFSLELGVDVAGKRVSLYPIIASLLEDRYLRPLLAEDTPIDPGATIAVRIDPQHVTRFPLMRLRAMVRTLLELLERGAQDKPDKLRLARVDAARLVDLAGQDIQWRGAQALRELGTRLRDFSGLAEVKPAATLTCTLRPYQQAGLNWMQFLRMHELAGILADDMGLGKTVQTIAHLATEKEAGRLQRPALIVAPTSLVHNWIAECTRFAPALSVLKLHGHKRADDFDKIAAHDVVITTYPLLPRDAEHLLKHEFHIAVYDEAQNLKNAKSRAAETAVQLRARHRLALTGTPLENNLGELWSQFNILLPGLLGDARRFSRLYRTPIEKYGDNERRAHLARRVKPFILRRTKEQVARELPPKTEIERAVDLTGAQRDLYETIRSAMEKRVREALAAQGLAKSHIVVLDALLKLRQVCCDPRLVKTPAAAKVKESAKLELLTALLPELIAEGRRILLFSQFTSMLELIEKELAAQKIEYVKLTGDTRDRKTPVERFQRGEVPLFVISLKAGGTGLNLTAADTVIHYDPWWNPAVEQQATDRAHRIGQDKPVFVYRLLAAGTVEERIRVLQKRKADLARGVLDEDAALAKALTAEDLQVLFEPLAG
jgi:superfamily II DNA or RNA helicase